MLSSMKTSLTAARALLYETTRVVDLRNSYTHIVEHGEPTAEDRAAKKYYERVAAALTPMCKALATETANKIAYDCIQILGGTGYMRDFNAERFYRDARITNIYEGTTQLQVVAAIGGGMQRALDTRIDELAAVELAPELAALRGKLLAMREQQKEAAKFVSDLKNTEYHDYVSRDLVEMETMIFVGMLLLRDAAKCADRAPIAERYIQDNFAQYAMRYQRVMSGEMKLLDNKRDIIDY